MYCAEIVWGDVPTWLIAGFTLGALIAAVVAGRLTWALLKVEQERDRERAQERRNAVETQARAQQADLVAGWHVEDEVERWRPPGLPASRAVVWGLHLRNASPLPVYNVLAECIAESDGRVAQSLNFPVLATGEHFTEWPEEVRTRSLSDDGTDIFTEPGDAFRASIQFRDTANRWWLRDVEGALHSCKARTSPRSSP